MERHLIASTGGKGGTGKTMLASSLALLFSRGEGVVACDCDVDAPNLGLWLGITEYDSRERISTSEKATVSLEKCVECDECLEACRFGAVEKTGGFTISPLTHYFLGRHGTGRTYACGDQDLRNPPFQDAYAGKAPRGACGSGWWRSSLVVETGSPMQSVG